MTRPPTAATATPTPPIETVPPGENAASATPLLPPATATPPARWVSVLKPYTAIAVPPARIATPGHRHGFFFGCCGAGGAGGGTGGMSCAAAERASEHASRSDVIVRMPHLNCRSLRTGLLLRCS